MTTENYIKYLVGTACEYPQKNKRHLKNMFVDAKIATTGEQIFIAPDVDSFVDIANKELNDQVKSCLANSEDARLLFEKWEFEKDYKYSTLFECSDMDRLYEKARLCDKRDEKLNEASRSSNGFDNPLCWEIDNYIFFKFSIYFSAVDPLNGQELLLKYPILIVVHREEEIIEFRFDTLRHLFLSERQIQTFYCDLVDRLLTFSKQYLEVDLTPLNVEFLHKIHPGATLMSKYMMLPSGGNAHLDVGKNENYILPIIGELKEILDEHKIELDMQPSLKEALDQFMYENDEMSECPWIEIMWENEIKVRSIKVKFVFNYKNHPYCLLQHYFNSVLVGMERMNHVVRYIRQHKADAENATDTN